MLLFHSVEIMNFRVTNYYRFIFTYGWNQCVLRLQNRLKKSFNKTLYNIRIPCLMLTSNEW